MGNDYFRMSHIFKFVFVIFMILQLISCGGHSKQQTKEKIITIESKPNTTTLNYTGLIKPIQTVSINNVQADGTIAKKNFEYGKIVTKNQLLFEINSKQLAKNYQEALSQYVKSKKLLNDAQYQMTGAEELKKLKILSQQEYLNTKSQLFNAKLEHEQATNKLQDILVELGLDTKSMDQLSSVNEQTLHSALEKIPSVVKIIAPENGIALMPEENNSKENSKGPLMKGENVKSGQSLLQIGDMSGISISVKVNQIYVEQIKEGQKAIITSEAFPGLTLEGQVAYVGRQSATGDNNGGGIPNFEVSVIVPKIEKTALEKIRVGMSADVAFPLETAATIKIPINAVAIKQGVSIVKKVASKFGKATEVAVNTGRTEMDSVEILDGLKSGDRILVYETAS